MGLNNRGPDELLDSDDPVPGQRRIHRDMIDIILWDVDGTLLDFNAAEKAAIRTLFAEFDLGECTDTMLARYSQIKTGFWQKLERNELTRPQVLHGRFEQFFGEYGIDTAIVPEFNRRYADRLRQARLGRRRSFLVLGRYSLSPGQGGRTNELRSLRKARRRNHETAF